MLLQPYAGPPKRRLYPRRLGSGPAHSDCHHGRSRASSLCGAADQSRPFARPGFASALRPWNQRWQPLLASCWPPCMERIQRAPTGVTWKARRLHQSEARSTHTTFLLCSLGESRGDPRWCRARCRGAAHFTPTRRCRLTHYAGSTPPDPAPAAIPTSLAAEIYRDCMTRWHMR